MRFLVSAVVLILGLAGSAAKADPAEPPARQPAVVEDAGRLGLGVTPQWTPARLGRHIRIGLGFVVPQRWYDVDGQLLTERSLLHPGDDLERSGLYLALRF